MVDRATLLAGFTQAVCPAVDRGQQGVPKPVGDEAKRLELWERVASIPGVEIPADAIGRRPTISLAAFTDHGKLQAFLSVLDWYVGEVMAV